MEQFGMEFVMNLFLESDHVSDMNRIIIAAANLIHESNETTSLFTNVIKKQINDETDSMKESTENVNKPNALHENILPTLELIEDNFTDVFKMSKTTFQELLSSLKDIDEARVASTITLEIRIQIFLWFLSHNSSYKEISKIFKITLAMVKYVICDMALMLAEQRYYFIKWPSIEEQHISRIKINSRFKMPNCVGFLDACRFRITYQSKRGQKKNYILLQAVCNETLAFLDIFVGTLGETVKGKVFKQSPLARELKNFIEFENHVLGDSDYKLKKNLVIPFTCEELLTSEEMKYNEVLLTAHSVIGQSFELLKERFTRLNLLEVRNVEDARNIIYAACVLHNFIIFNEDQSRVKEEMVLCEESVYIDNDIVQNAADKRQFLCNYIGYMESENNKKSDDNY